MTYQTRLSQDGMVPLSRMMIDDMGLKPGDALAVDQTADGLVIRRNGAREQALQRLRAALAGYSVDQFLQERAADWRE